MPCPNCTASYVPDHIDRDIISSCNELSMKFCPSCQNTFYKFFDKDKGGFYIIRENDLALAKQVLGGYADDRYPLFGVPHDIASAFRKARDYRARDPETSLMWIRKTLELFVKNNIPPEESDFQESLHRRMEFLSKNHQYVEKFYRILSHAKENENVVVHEKILQKIPHYISVMYGLLQLSYTVPAQIEFIEQEVSKIEADSNNDDVPF